MASKMYTKLDKKQYSIILSMGTNKYDPVMSYASDVTEWIC